MHNDAIDTVISESSSLFKQCILAHTALHLGQGTLSGFPDSVCIKTATGLNVEIEPIPMAELKHYTEGLPHFLLEVFHGRMVQVWQECLLKLFRILVDLHFSGKRKFAELKKRDIVLDFQATPSLEAQMTERLCRGFEFERYSDKVKLLNGVFNPINEQPEHLLNVAKHVQIRNSFQHRRGIVDEFLLKELGLQKIALLNFNGESRDYQLNDNIQISIPEFDAFRRSLLMVGQLWRKWNG
jgi:hypothetical protein